MLRGTPPTAILERSVDRIPVTLKRSYQSGRCYVKPLLSQASIMVILAKSFSIMNVILVA